jgi:hypothetical protein
MRNQAIILAHACRNSLHLDAVFGVQMPIDLMPLLSGASKDPWGGLKPP